MVALRNLVTRFSFETDNRGVQSFNKTVGAMKADLAEIATLIGIGFGSKAIVDAGTALQQANTALKTSLQLGGNVEGDFTRVQKAIDGVSFSIEGVDKSVRDLASTSELTNLAADFFGDQGIKATTESIEQFQTILKAATALAVASGDDIGTSFREIVAGIKFGDISAILPLGATDRLGAAFSRFQASLKSEADLLEPQTFKRNLIELVRLLDEAAPEIQGTLKIADEEGLLKFLTTERKTETAFEELGRKAKEALGPAAELITLMAEGLIKATEGAESLSGVFANLLLSPVAQKVLGFDLSKEETKELEARAETVKTTLARRAPVFNPNILAPGAIREDGGASLDRLFSLLENVPSNRPITLDGEIIIRTNEGAVFDVVDKRLDVKNKETAQKAKQLNSPQETVPAE